MYGVLTAVYSVLLCAVCFFIYVFFGGTPLLFLRESLAFSPRSTFRSLGGMKVERVLEGADAPSIFALAV